MRCLTRCGGVHDVAHIVTARRHFIEMATRLPYFAVIDAKGTVWVAPGGGAGATTLENGHPIRRTTAWNACARAPVPYLQRISAGRALHIPTDAPLNADI